MRLTDKLLVGMVGGAAALYGARQWLRARRRMELPGKVVVVTGASSGLGLLTARYAAEHGAHVVIAARDAEELERAAADLRQTGAKVLAVPTDVSQKDQADQLIRKAVEQFGRIDILIANAGIMVVAPVENMTVEDCERVMATNFWGAVYPTLAAVPYMQQQQSGRICHVSSVGGKVPAPHMLAYTASKFGLTGFSEGLRAELMKDNVYVTGIYPGTIRTGGHCHAEMKGNAQAEYAWFALADVIPGLSACAYRCTDALWDAVLHGDPEVVFGAQAKAAVAFHSLLPSWYAEVSPLINAALPSPTDQPSSATRGAEIGGRIAAFVNKVIPPGTRPKSEPAGNSA